MGVTFEVDHIVPAAGGGKTRLSNLCLCCPTCNRHTERHPEETEKGL